MSRFVGHTKWCLFGWAFAFRLFWIFFLARDLAFDEVFYHTLGSNLASGLGYSMNGTPHAFWPPGYPLFLALVFSLFGKSIVVVKIVQAFLGALSCILLLDIGKALYDEQTARWAAWIWAIYPTHAVASGLLITETFFTFLVVVAFALLPRHKDKMVFLVLSGIALGMATLVRPEALFLSFVFGFAYVKESVKSGVKVGIVLFVVALVVITPWIVRNWIVMERFIMVSDSGGFNFWLGNHPLADGSNRRLVSNSAWPYPDQGFDVGYTIGLGQILAHPVWFVQLVFKKLSYFFGLETSIIPWLFNSTYVDRDVVKFLLLGSANVFYLGTIFGALVHLTLSSKPLKSSGKILLIVMYFSLIRVLFFGDPRHHYVLIPFLLLTSVKGWSLLRRQKFALLARSKRAIAFIISTGIIGSFLAYYIWAEWVRLSGKV